MGWLIVSFVSLVTDVTAKSESRWLKVTDMTGVAKVVGVVGGAMKA